MAVIGFETTNTQTYVQGVVKSLSLPGMKQTTATEDFDVHISYLLS